MMRRGFTLVELTVSLSIVVVALSVGMTALVHSQMLRKNNEKREAAREAVAVGLERARALSGAQLPKIGESRELGLPPHLAARLPGATCRLSLNAVPEQAGLVRARLEVIWQNNPARSGAPAGGAGVPARRFTSESGEVVFRLPAAEGKP